MKNIFTTLLLLLLFSGLTIVKAQAPVTPADASTGVSQATASVSWTAFNDANNAVPDYDAELSTTGAFAGEETALVVAGTSATLPALQFNTTYYWRVRDTDTDGAGLNGAWSSTFTFTTEIATPVVTAPAASAVGVSLTPTVTWTFAGGTAGVTFEVETATDAGFTTNLVSHTTTATGTSFNITSALTAGTQYWVRVTSQKAGESDKVSLSVTFKTIYATPALVSPINDAKDVNINYDVYFDWNPVVAAPGFYQIQISDNSSFSTTEVDQYVANPTTFAGIDLSGLDYYTTYYWRVRATELNPIGAGNYSAWSSTRFFRTIDNYNAVLFFPTNGSTDIPNSSVTFGWGLTQRLDYTSFLFPKFKIVYDKDGSFTPGDGFNPVVVSGISVTTFFLGLDAGQTYYWKVITVKDNNQGEDYQESIITGALTVGTTYRVKVAGTTDFSAVGGPAVPVIGDEFTVTATSVPALTPTWAGGTELIIAGDVGESPTWSFTTSGAVVKPTIAYPKDETTVYSSVPIFYWYTTGFNTIHEYEIEWTEDIVNHPLSANGTPYAAIVANAFRGKKTAIPGLFGYPTPALNGGKHVYWHVRTIIGTTVSDWSDTEDFFTFDGVDASIPSPAYPTGGVEVYSLFPRLYWVLNGPSQGLTFNVYYVSKTDAEALGGLGATFDDADTANVAYKKIYNISQLYVTLYNGITSGETYFWKVQSYNGTTYSDLSDEAEFKIYNFSADLIPILSWPIGGNLVYSTDVNFAWHVEGPSLGLTYELDIEEDILVGDDLDGVPEFTGLTSNLFTTTLTAGTSYEWKVRVEGETTWSSKETFTVISGGGSTVPVLNWPVGGATVWSTSQDLSWSLIGGGSPTFRVEVYTNVGLTTHFTGSPFTAVAGSPLTLTGLTAGATYYWRVRVEPSEPWSNVEVFIVFAGLDPQAPPMLAPVPRLGSPVGGVEVASANPTLSFFLPAYTEGQITYEVEYSQNADFSNSIVKTNLAEPKYNAEGLSAGTWYWRVRGKDAEGYSGYSDEGSFVVTGVTDVEGEEGLPQSYELSQNYPNPFNPTTAIKYNLPESNYVTLKIYNMLGQEIRTLVSGQANAGSYNVIWNGKDNSGHNVSSGAYIYQIVAGNFVQTRKMILLK